MLISAEILFSEGFLSYWVVFLFFVFAFFGSRAQFRVPHSEFTALSIGSELCILHEEPRKNMSSNTFIGAESLLSCPTLHKLLRVTALFYYYYTCTKGLCFEYKATLELEG